MSKFDYINEELAKFREKEKPEHLYRFSASMIGNKKGVGVPRSEKEKAAISLRMKGNQTRLGKMNSDKQKQAVRDWQKKRSKKERQEAWLKVDQKARHSNYKDKELHRQKAINNMKHKMINIVALKEGRIVGEYESIMEASRKLKVNSGSISFAIKNPNNKAGGYKFKKI